MAADLDTVVPKLRQLSWEELPLNSSDPAQGVVGVLRLNRPAKLNAWTQRMALELVHLFGAADAADHIKAVVVTGAPCRVFCAGADLMPSPEDHELQEYPHNDGVQDSLSHRDSGGAVGLAIHRCRKPIIAAINGSAVGIGITMTLPMDMRVVSSEAKIGFVFAKRGLVQLPPYLLAELFFFTLLACSYIIIVVPEACSSYFLPRIVGETKATEWCLTGRVFRAKAEEDSGLFTKVVPPEAVLDTAMALARECAQCSAVSIALTKGLLRHSSDPYLAHLYESRCLSYSFSSDDFKEGAMSFLQKRPANFSLSPWKDIPAFYPWWHNTDVQTPFGESAYNRARL